MVTAETFIPMEEPTNDRGELFSQLLVANRHRIYGFIYSLLHNHAASEDLMQEVSTILWRKFDQFEEGTDFVMWAMSVARFCSLNWRRKQARLPVTLEDEDLVRLADEAMGVCLDDEDRKVALRECLAKMPKKLLVLLQSRYYRDDRVTEIAEKEGCSVRKIYMLLEKAHGMLLDCIQRTVQNARGGGADL